LKGTWFRKRGRGPAAPYVTSRRTNNPPFERGGIEGIFIEKGDSISAIKTKGEPQGRLREGSLF